MKEAHEKLESLQISKDAGSSLGVNLKGHPKVTKKQPHKWLTTPQSLESPNEQGGMMQRWSCLPGWWHHNLQDHKSIWNTEADFHDWWIHERGQTESSEDSPEQWIEISYQKGLTSSPRGSQPNETTKILAWNCCPLGDLPLSEGHLASHQ